MEVEIIALYVYVKVSGWAGTICVGDRSPIIG